MLKTTSQEQSPESEKNGAQNRRAVFTIDPLSASAYLTRIAVLQQFSAAGLCPDGARNVCPIEGVLLQVALLETTKEVESG